MNKTLWNYDKQSADGQNAIAMFNKDNTIAATYDEICL